MNAIEFEVKFHSGLSPIGFTEKAEGAEMWKEKENLIQKFIEEDLEMESKDIIIERVHKTGFKINDKKKDIMQKFLNHKDKDAAQNQYRQKQLWIDNIYVNEDYRECTAKLRKKLFEHAKEIRQSGKF